MNSGAASSSSGSARLSRGMRAPLAEPGVVVSVVLHHAESTIAPGSTRGVSESNSKLKQLRARSQMTISLMSRQTLRIAARAE